MEVEHLIAIAAVVITAIFLYLFVSTSKSNNGSQSSESSAIAARKLHFTLPIVTADLKQMLEESAIAARLGLTRDDGCVVTISLDIQQLGSYECCAKILPIMNRFSNVFFVIKAVTDGEENTAYESLCKVNIDSPISRHRFLFYESGIGKLAIIRQLKPQLHIDYEILTCRQIGPHIKSVVHIMQRNKVEATELPSSSSGAAKRIHSIDRIEDLLTLSIR